MPAAAQRDGNEGAGAGRSGATSDGDVLDDHLVPRVELATDAPSRVSGVETVVLPFWVEDDGPVLGPGAAVLLDELDADLIGLLEHHKAAGSAGEAVSWPVLGPPESAPDLREVLLVGLGAGRPEDLRRAGTVVARRCKGRGTVATSVPAATDGPGLRAFVEGVVLGAFAYSLKTGDRTDPVGTVVLASMPSEHPDTVRDRDLGLTAGRAGWLARVLALVPSNVKNPGWMADQAVRLAERHGLESEVWDERRLAAEGFGGLVAVGQASATPPRLVRLSYNPPAATRRTPHVVLVGKGITFDTGGLSIKPAAAMTTMKRDMTGAGVVLAVLAALGEVGCPVRVTGLLALAENAVSGNALRPGDVLRHYGGRTSEVTNTDAEGRLVLADPLAYACATLEPTVLVDVATLTGAMKVALGQRTGGFFANDDALAGLLSAAAAESGEPMWRMPLAADYEPHLESSVADADNAGGGPGAITAALFLQHFVGGVPWAHLDIASVGDSPVDAYEWTAGATGFGARLLLRWLGSDAPVDGIGVR